MIIFRHHRGLLDASMKTCREFETEEQLIRYIREYYEKDLVIDEIDLNKSAPPIADERIGWMDVRHVLVNKCCVGMWATDYARP